MTPFILISALLLPVEKGFRTDPEFAGSYVRVCLKIENTDHGCVEIDRQKERPVPQPTGGIPGPLKTLLDQKNAEFSFFRKFKNPAGETSTMTFNWKEKT